MVFTLQDLRRLAATAMERGRVPVYTLKAVLNHVSASDVTGGYVQVARDMKLSALGKIEDFVFASERGRAAAVMFSGNGVERVDHVHLQFTWHAEEGAGLSVGYLRLEQVTNGPSNALL